MNIEAVLPELEGDAARDIVRIRAYLLKFREELEFNLSNIDEENLTPAAFEKISAPLAEVKNLKAAVIRSASYIKSVEEKLEKTLKNEYFASGDAGELTEEALAKYEFDGKGFNQYFKLIETVNDSVKSLCGYVRTGVLENGEVGLEIGDFSGASPFKVRLADNRLSFYANGDEVAYVSDSTLYITKAQVTGKLILGDYHIDLTDGLAFCFVRRGEE